MLQSKIKEEIKNLVAHIAIADMVKIDDVLYIIKPGKNIDRMLEGHFEDLEPIFETDHHQFSWWEIREDSKRINNSEWQIGENVVSFYTIQPI